MYPLAAAEVGIPDLDHYDEFPFRCTQQDISHKLPVTSIILTGV